MPESDYGDFDDDDLIAVDAPDCAPSPRLAKRRRLNGTGESEAENVAPDCNGSSIAARKSALVTASKIAKQTVVKAKIPARPLQRPQPVRHVDSDSDESAFDPAPLRPHLVKQVIQFDRHVANQRNQNGGQRIALATAKSAHYVATDSDSDNAFDPPAHPVVSKTPARAVRNPALTTRGQ